MLCAIGNEIPDKVDGRSGMSALLRKMLPESILDNFGPLFTHSYILNSLSVSCAFLVRESAAIIRLHSSSSTQRTNISCCISTIRRDISRNGRFVGPPRIISKLGTKTGRDIQSQNPPSTLFTL